MTTNTAPQEAQQEQVQALTPLISELDIMILLESVLVNDEIVNVLDAHTVLTRVCQHYEADRLASRAREDELRAELTRVLEVAIARGEQLDYSDDDYRARYLELTGRDYDTEATDGQ